MVDALPELPPRARDSHKGDFGRLQIVGGSAGMAGAPALAARAALRGGAGLVQVVCPAGIRSTVTVLEPCATTALFGDADYQQFQPQVRAVGPGCRDELPPAVLEDLLRDSGVAVVVDADGLNLLARMESWWTLPGSHVVLTPHPGEMRRLLEQTTLDPGLDRAALAQAVAQLCGAVIVLKGHHTVVTDGRSTYVNTTGNPGMATGGSGDVLTGLIGALIGQALSPYDAACLGVYLHGKSGDLAAEVLGEISVTAMDLIDYLPDAIRAHQQAHRG